VAKKTMQKAIGLMSGTSADGADAALIATDGEDAIEFCGGVTVPYDGDLRARVLEASQYDVPIVELLRLERCRRSRPACGSRAAVCIIR
jgi:anhydro-N-acetylmuramic acid kinase